MPPDLLHEEAVIHTQGIQQKEETSSFNCIQGFAQSVQSTCSGTGSRALANNKQKTHAVGEERQLCNFEQYVMHLRYRTAGYWNVECLVEDSS